MKLRSTSCLTKVTHNLLRPILFYILISFSPLNLHCLYFKKLTFVRSIESDKRWREVQVPGLNYRPRSPRWNEGEEKEEKEMDQENKMDTKKEEKEEKGEKEEKMRVKGAKNTIFRLVEEEDFNQTKRLEIIRRFYQFCYNEQHTHLNSVGY